MTDRPTLEDLDAAPEPASWPQLEARAFNAVLPALREAGERPPLSARRAVARAVLDAIQPHLAGHYQHAVDNAIAAERRAERAEAALKRVRTALPPYDKPVHGDTSRGVQIGWDRARQAALGALEGQPAPGVREVRVVVHAPTDENAAHWAETIRDLVVAEYGDSMRLGITITPGGRS